MILILLIDIDVIHDVVDKNNNTHRSTTKMKPLILILMLNTMLIPMKKNPKFKDGDHVRVSKNKSIFPKGCAPNWSVEVFVFCLKLKILYHGLILLVIIMWKKLLQLFVKKNRRKEIKKNLE